MRTGTITGGSGAGSAAATARAMLVAAVVVAAIVASAVTPARAESPVALTVRIYNASRVPDDEVRAARLAAGPILRDTGIDVTFRVCGARGASGAIVDDCDDLLKPSEVVVRIIQAPAFNVSLHPHAYGMSYVVDSTHRGWLATVFSDRVADAATRVDLDRGTLLGRVLAHEVGHLLLGNGYHGDTGVMQALWTDELLEVRDAEKWRFSMREADVIQRALASGTR